MTLTSLIHAKLISKEKGKEITAKVLKQQWSQDPRWCVWAENCSYLKCQKIYPTHVPQLIWAKTQQLMSDLVYLVTWLSAQCWTSAGTRYQWLMTMHSNWTDFSVSLNELESRNTPFKTSKLHEDWWLLPGSNKEKHCCILRCYGFHWVI